MVELRQLFPTRTTISLGLPKLHERFGARLQIKGKTSEEVVAELVVFLNHLPALTDIIREQEQQEGILGSVLLRIHDDYSLEVQWMDKDLKAHKELWAPPEST
jgi:hypothetical protein